MATGGLARKPEPLCFTGNVAENWIRFEMEYDVYNLLDCLPEETTERQKAMMLLNLAGTEAIQREKSFVYHPGRAAILAQEGQPGQPAVPAESRYTVDVLKRKFGELCAPQRNVIMERHTFNSRCQSPGESFSNFYADLRVLASTCNFNDLHDDLIRDRIVTGIRGDALRKQLLKEPELTLARAVSICQIAEHTDQSMSKFNSPRADRVQFKPNKQSKKSSKTSSKTTNSKEQTKQKKEDSKKCSRCNYIHRSQRPDACPALGATCKNCGKANHFASVCRSPSVNTVEVEDRDSPAFLGSVSTDTSADRWKTSLKICGQPLSFKIDSGADVSVISLRSFQTLKTKPALKPYTAGKLHSPGGPVQPVGYFITSVSRKNTQFDIKFVVVDAPIDNLLSREAGCDMKLIARLDAVVSAGETFGCLDTKPVQITLKSDCTPYAVSVARRVPIPLEEKVKLELIRLQEADIIQQVTKPTDWCCGMVPVLKKSGEVRICVDLKRLNAAVKRERYTLPTLDDVTSKLSGASVFTCLDAASGFYQIPLHEDSQELTTFMTPFGRYCFKRLPFGITSAPEIFMRKMVQMLEGLDGVFCYMDDILIFGKDQANHDANLEKTLKRLKEAGLKLNQQKCKYRQSEVAFLGHIFSKDGVRPDPSKVEAITDMKPPGSVQEIRQFLGMVHYLGSYLPSLHTVTEPLNALLRKDVAWNWDHSQQNAFDEIKRMVTQAPTLQFYNVERPTRVSADASSYGLGGALMQLHDDQWKPVAFCSRTLTPAECNYAQIEKECLASVWACEKFARYLCGLENISLVTDHKPLVPLINTKDLSDVPVRCQRLLMRLMNFSVQAEYHPGHTLVVADTLSRIPINGEAHTAQEEDVRCFVGSIINAIPASPKRLEEIREATKKDQTLSKAIKLTLSGWPHKQKDVPDDLVPFFKQKSNLSVIDGLLTFGSRIVIPEALQADVTHRLHDGHLGVEKCLQKAKMCVWWPKMTDQVKAKVGNCELCRTLAPAQRKQPLMPTKLPEGPWKRLGADLCFHKGCHYLVVVDYFSRFIEILKMSSDTTTANVISKLKAIFARFGIPNEIVSDNGPQFSSSQFAEFMKTCGTMHTTSSPHHPSSNGAAERAVQTAKKILSQEDPWLGLLAYRSSPLKATGFSPSQLLMGRNLQTTIPCLPSALKPKWPSARQVQRNDKIAKEGYATYYNRRHGARPLAELQKGQQVLIRTDGDDHWTKKGTVQEHAAQPRSYFVETDRGIVRRNRRHLVVAPPATSPCTSESPVIVPMDSPVTSPSAVTPPPPVSPSSSPSPNRSDVPERPVTTQVTRSGRPVKPPRRLIAE